MLVKVLETTYPSLKVDPIDNVRALSAANSSPIQLIGSVDLQFHFSRPSLERTQSGEWALKGPVMQY